jgi:hypothetical protein
MKSSDGDLLERRGFLGVTAAAIGAAIPASASGSCSTNSDVYDRTIDFPPTVLIQDALNEIAFLIPAEHIDLYRTGPEAWASMGRGTVTFVIPDDDMFHVIPPFIQDPSERPSVLIQHPTRKVSYFVSAENLDQYKHAQKDVAGLHYDISFAMPIHLALVEKLPAPIKALLQSGTKIPPIKHS